MKLINKFLILGLLLIMTMSVTMAAEVSDDTASNVLTPSEKTINEPTTEVVETNNVEQINQINSYNSISTDTIINDSTWDNQIYDVTSNVKITTNITQSNNIAFNLNGNNITIDGLNIVNDETQPICINIANGSSNINILNCNITIVNTDESQTFGIYMENSNYVTVRNSNISLSAVSQPLYIYNPTTEWYDYSLKVASIVADSSSNVTIDNNKFYLTTSTEVSPTNGGTGNVILIQNGAEDITVTNNIIEAENYPYTYAITGTYGNNILVENNIINLRGNNYICGVQFSSASNSAARRNTINGNCTATSGNCPSYEAFAYGIISITGTWGAPNSEAVGNIIEYNDVTLNSTIAYAYELSNAENNILHNNTATVIGNVVMALGIYNSSYNNIINNTFIVTGNTIDLNDYIYEAVVPVTTGIKILDDGFNNTQNNSIIGNTIDVTDSNSYNLYDIILENTNNTTITNNYMTFIFLNPRILDGGINTSINSNYRLL